MTAVKMTREQKKAYAQLLYTREQLEGKVVAERVGVSAKTISNWVTEGNWKVLRSRLVAQKENQINVLYDQLEKLNDAIKDSKEGYADTKQADILIKLTAAINNLETDLNIADQVEAGIRFVRHLQQTTSHEKVQEVAELWNSFITSLMASK